MRATENLRPFSPNKRAEISAFTLRFSMNWNPFAPIWRQTPAQFSSDFDLETSVSRLKTATKWSFRALFQIQTGVFGRVSEKSVRLSVLHRNKNNSFAPEFRGKFRSQNGRVVLCGAFAINRFVQIFATFFLIFALLFGVGATLVCAFQGRWLEALSALGGGGFLSLFLIFLLQTPKWTNRDDVKLIGAAIEKALKAN